MRISEKEKRRGCAGWTVVVRPDRRRGGYAVSTVDEDGNVFGRPQYVETKSEISKAVGADLRMLDKCALGGEMSSASRRRRYMK